jgi:hypothetical protein
MLARVWHGDKKSVFRSLKCNLRLYNCFDTVGTFLGLDDEGLANPAFVPVVYNNTLRLVIIIIVFLIKEDQQMH